MRFLKWIIFIAVAAYLAVTAFVFFTQRSFQYFPPDVYVTPQAAGVDMKEINYSMRPGVGAGINTVPDLTFWYAAPASDTAPVIMFFHGNGSAVYSNSHIFSDLMAEGYGVLSVAYTGYPGSGGCATQNAIVRAVKFQRDWLGSQGITDERIVYFGTSLGSGVAAQLTALEPPALLIMDAPFNSTLDMGKRMMPFLPVNLLMKDRFRSDLALQTYDGPMIWMHGTKDRIIPISQGQKLYDGYDGPKSAHVFEGGHHTNLWELGGREIVLSRLGEMFPFAAPQDHADIESGED